MGQGRVFFRTYSVEELNELINKLDNNNFNWDTGKIKSGPSWIIYVIGIKNSI